MSASGLIYAAIALMWAAVLIPMWLRSHDTASENRQVERFGQAMRVLSRRESREAEEHRDQRREEPRRRESSSRSAVVEQRPRRKQPTARRSRPSRTLAQRRARTLGVLAGLTVVLALAATLSPLPWWTPLPVATLLVAFVVHLRVQAIQQQKRRRRPARRAEGVGRAPAARGSAAEGGRDKTARSERGAAESTAASSFVDGPSRAVTVETKGRAADQDIPEPAAAGDESTPGWDPNPLPLPTYVTAPKAVRPIKVIDLTTPGAWTSGRLLDDGLAEEDLLAAEVAADELDALLEHEAAPDDADKADEGRRAVGD